MVSLTPPTLTTLCPDQAGTPNRQQKTRGLRSAAGVRVVGCTTIMVSAHGRARHPWLTGTAGWMYTAATRYILGVRTGFDGLMIDPCIPATWPGFRITRQGRGATYHITVQNPYGLQKGVQSATPNGQPGEFPIPPPAAGAGRPPSLEPPWGRKRPSAPPRGVQAFPPAPGKSPKPLPH